MSSATSAPRPFLKWAGGKRQLLPTLRRYYPDALKCYYEPFLGSGAVFFDLWSLGRLEGRRVCLSDGNADLIGSYLRVRDSVEAVMYHLSGLADGHARSGSAHYYEVRNDRFNPVRSTWQGEGGRADAYTPAMAAMLIYLNRTGYNGLFRQNARGEYNVPAGRYDRPRILDEAVLRSASMVLASANVTIAEAPFQCAVESASRGDFAYFDPPYAPLSRTSSFHAYTAQGFTHDDHARLHAAATALARRGVIVLLSNSTAPVIRRLYERDADARAAGLRACRIPARRVINSRRGRRGAIEELLVSNLPVHTSHAAKPQA